MEIRSAVINTGDQHSFSFSQKVQQFFVGFSELEVHFYDKDHHVRDIEIDLQNAQKNGNEVAIKPFVRISDRHEKSESFRSYINVVVIALVGEGDPDVYMLNRVKVNENFELPWDKVTFIKSSLTYTKVSYWDTDHHLANYYSFVYPDSEENPYLLKGKALMTDRHVRNQTGIVSADVIAYNGIDSNVLCCSFSSNNVGKYGSVCFGDKPQNFNPDDYKLACIIRGFDISFHGDTDHHLYQIHLKSKIENEKLFEKDGKIYAKVDLTAYLEDSSKNRTDIGHNELRCFIIAYKKNKPEEKQYTLEEFANEYNSISSSIVNQ